MSFYLLEGYESDKPTQNLLWDHCVKCGQSTLPPSFPHYPAASIRDEDLFVVMIYSPPIFGAAAMAQQ